KGKVQKYEPHTHASNSDLPSPLPRIQLLSPNLTACYATVTRLPSTGGSWNRLTRKSHGSLPEDGKEALKAARELVTKEVVGNGRQGFLDRLKEDGGEKIITYRQNFLHVEYSRFLPLVSQVKGLTIEEALLQVRWLRKRISRKMEEALSEAIVKAKDSGLDLSKTYIADAFVEKNGAILSQELRKRYLRGRGRYGATRTQRRHLWRWRRLRKRLGERMEGLPKSAEEVYESVKAKRPTKVVHC
ncbi:hypothetical protein BC829DRAFT_409507, partial [Chytridium lagenaria]